MSKNTSTTYFCDNILLCSSRQDSGHGLPTGWFAVTYAVEAGRQAHRHFCSCQCVRDASQGCLEWGEEDKYN